LELRELVELELDMALATAVSIWGPRAASTAATSFCRLICSEAAAALVEDEDWAFIVVSRFWLLPWKLLLLPWNLEVVVLLPCSAVAASTADVIDGPRAERTDSIT